MNATDELRRLLDERGVEHFDGTETTLWGYEPTSESTGVYRFAADETSGGRMQVRMFNLTPEQAVEATLGREPDDAAMVKLHDQMNAALLEYERAQGIEMRYGDAAVTVPFVAKMHELLEEAATLGRGTCHLISAPQYGEGCQECSACGAVSDEYMFESGRCPSCGAKVVDE